MAPRQLAHGRPAGTRLRHHGHRHLRDGRRNPVQRDAEVDRRARRPRRGRRPDMERRHGAHVADSGSRRRRDARPLVRARWPPVPGGHLCRADRCRRQPDRLGTEGYASDDRVRPLGRRHGESHLRLRRIRWDWMHGRDSGRRGSRNRGRQRRRDHPLTSAPRAAELSRHRRRRRAALRARRQLRQQRPAAPTPTVLSAPINPDFTLGAWRDEESMPVALARFGLAVY